MSQLLRVRLEYQHLAEALPRPVQEWLTLGQQRVRDFWDVYPAERSVEWVECDYGEAANAILASKQSLRKTPPNPLCEVPQEPRFLEWGAGFGVVTGVAQLLGFSAVGIESERFLCRESLRLHREFGLPEANIWHGNFLPPGAEDLAEAEDPRVSLSRAKAAVYERHGSKLEDFEVVFAYPWPGEEHFLKSVFCSFAADESLLILYRGPFQIEFYRKVPTGRLETQR